MVMIIARKPLQYQIRLSEQQSKTFGVIDEELYRLHA